LDRTFLDIRALHQWMMNMRLKSPSRTAICLSLLMAGLVATTIYAQRNADEKTSDETTVKLVCELLQRFHIKQAKIDDKVSQLLLDRYLKLLDPQHLYFVQADIDEFAKYRNDLDDLVKVGDVSFAYQAFDLYLKRMDERIAWAQEFVDADHDYTLDEEMTIDTEKMPWAKSEAELKERWRKRVKYDLLTLKIEGTAAKEARERLHKRYHNVQQTMRQTERFEKLEMYLSALTHCFDPHSTYMSPQSVEDFGIQMRLQLQGIGAALKSEEGFTVVASIVPGGAADKDGRLKVGDKIIAVAQGDGKWEDIVELKLSKVVRYIRGEKGTVVRLRIKKADSADLKEYALTRQVIELKSSEVKGEIIQTKDRVTGTDSRIGVISIPSFYRDFDGAKQGLDNFKSTSRDVRKVLQDFEKAGRVDAVVIDLRMNGGGALSEAIEVSGLFIDEGPVVQVKEQNGRIRSHDDVESGVAYAGPLVVICNKLSASASEIFAGVIKDYRRGIIIGDSTTHGKGTVQNVMPVSKQLFQFLKSEDRGALKLTIQQFYRVNGDSTQNLGVPSDIVLPSIIDQMDLGEASLDNALKFDRVPAASFRALDYVSPTIISALKLSSEKRVAADPKFQEIKADIARFLERKKRKQISLNEVVLKKERDEDKKRDKNDKDKLKLDEDRPEGPIFPQSAYNDEILRVTLQYNDLLKQARTAGNN